MTSLPKPPQREPKPRKWIRRTRLPRRSTILRAASSSDYRTRERRCNRLWVQVIYRKGRVGKWCERCLKRPWSDAAHCFIKGKYRGLRFEPSNGWPLCRHCHGEVDSDHLAKETFFRRVLGDQEYERLELRAKTTRGKTDLALVEIDLRQILGRKDHGREEAAGDAPVGQLQPEAGGIRRVPRDRRRAAGHGARHPDAEQAPGGGPGADGPLAR